MALTVLTEFFVDHTEPNRINKRVFGRVYNGTVRLDQCFDYVYDGKSSTSTEIADALSKSGRQVCLKVEKIEAYYRSTDLLESGTTGTIELSGQGMDSIKSGDILVVLMPQLSKQK